MITNGVELASAHARLFVIRIDFFDLTTTGTCPRRKNRLGEEHLID